MFSGKNGSFMDLQMILRRLKMLIVDVAPYSSPEHIVCARPLEQIVAI